MTQLDVKSQKVFRVRHAVCFEHDALLIKISYPDHQSLDLIGRAVVLAFRLSGLPSAFPNIATQGDLISAASPLGSFSWKKKILTKDEKLKYFKGEQWGTSSIYLSDKAKPRPRSTRSTLSMVRTAIKEFDVPEADSGFSFGANLTPNMSNGPDWSRSAAIKFAEHAKEMYDVVCRTISVMASEVENAAAKKPSKKSMKRGKRFC